MISGSREMAGRKHANKQHREKLTASLGPHEFLLEPTRISLAGFDGTGKGLPRTEGK